MTSKTSLNNPMHGFFASWRYALQKTRATAFLYIGMLALFLPVLFALICSGIYLNASAYNHIGIGGSAWGSHDLLNLTMEMQASFLVLVSLCGKVITTVFTIALSVQLFGYMHKKRSVDTFHALPVRRMPMLLGNMAAALSVLLVPMLLAFLVSGLIASMHRALTFEFWVQFLLPLLGDTLLGMVSCFAFVLFMLVASGTVMDAVVSALILSVAYPTLYSLVQLFLEITVQGYASMWDFTVITALSPFAAYFAQFYWLIVETTNSDTYTLVMGTPWGYTLWWAFASAALLAGAVLLYRRRKSEQAESTYAFAGVKETMKFLISAACAFGLGFIAVLIYQTEIVFILFALLGGFAANTAVEALYSRGLRRFGRGCITYGAFAAAFLVFYGVSVFGAFGYGATAPAAKDIAYVTMDYPYYYYSAEINEDGESVTLMDQLMLEYADVYLRTSDDRYIASLTDAYESQEDIESVLYLQKVLARDVLQPPYGVSSTINDFNVFTIEYHLFNGSTVTRSFRIPWELAEGFSGAQGNSYSSAEETVVDTVLDLRTRGVRSDAIRQIMANGKLSEWNIRYEEYTHAEELNALDQLTGEAYEKKYEELTEKYGDDLYAVTSYECYSDLGGTESDELLEILRSAPSAGLYDAYNNGYVYVEFFLPVDALDSAYVDMLAKGHDDAFLRMSISTSFGRADEELMNFVKEHGEQY